jgi:hypothetical protein
MTSTGKPKIREQLNFAGRILIKTMPFRENVGGFYEFRWIFSFKPPDGRGDRFHSFGPKLERAIRIFQPEGCEQEMSLRGIFERASDLIRAALNCVGFLTLLFPCSLSDGHAHHLVRTE